MRKKIKLQIPIISTLFIFPSLSFVLAATSTYVPLEPNAFPGISMSSGNLGVFLGQAFNWAIAVAVVAALVMIIWGGIEYMTTDSWSGKNDGKTKIQNALWGLGLALISWLILYTINPCLIDFTGSNGCSAKNQLINPPPQSTNATGGSNTDNANLSGGVGPFSSPSLSGTGSNGGNSTSGCDNCEAISGILAVKSGISGYELNKDLVSKLQIALQGQPVQVTEAYPPDVQHISSCHYDGTCADINFINRSTDVNDVKNLFVSLRNAGLNPQYEVVDLNECPPYTAAGIRCTSYDDTYASHFHVGNLGTNI